MADKIQNISILPNIEERLEDFATNLEKFPIYRYERSQMHWLRESDPMELLNCKGSPLSTALKVKRDPITGEVLDFQEVSLIAAGADAQNSMLLNRAPAPPTQSTRGNALYIPFLPSSFLNDELNLQNYENMFDKEELLTVPPGFKRGLNFGDDGCTVVESSDKNIGNVREVLSTNNVVNLLEMAENEQNTLGIWDDIKQNQDSTETIDEEERELTPEEEAVLPKEPMVLEISKVADSSLKETEWAVMLDTTKSVKDFEQKVPRMACKFENFELDPFQKLAILHLEQHNHVFVAAHTSAGKTVVAEYAIAMSQKHLTKTIYTSPIKALSNQKYRDFKKTFKDVGLITGDFQINQTANCLIMTTEILRSMLYCGSDITRDLEFVIFDEVHYINDKERGHVWEQVLILLPAHVCVVLLSATVPNPLKFADWLGRTHRRKVYVITTPKRPVPLHHYLYTGVDKKTKSEKYLILNASTWDTSGYIAAKNQIALQTKNNKFTDRRQFTEKQDQALWSELIKQLKKDGLLPVIAFTFSRAKCDRNAYNLSKVDLTDQEEKEKIKSFYQKCINKLKEPADRQLPQILLMRELLIRGIGVHHSGLLPIIKEIVEMLFQDALIKLLFTTETFAMGVNMPAKTVVFDAIRKHDGQEWRNLNSAEYVQMAGRAGRRNQDKVGTVIILCKNQLAPESMLREMMTGQSQNLTSQFRLTYGMVLSILRVESLSVEGMMSRSFGEAEREKNMIVMKNTLEDVKRELKQLDAVSDYLLPLVDFYDSAKGYLLHREKILPQVMLYPKVPKVLSAGRVVLISLKHHINKLAIILSSSLKQNKLLYKVFVLKDATENQMSENKPDLWYKMVSISLDNIFVANNQINYEIFDVQPSDILEITRKNIKVAATNMELILKDWENRQIPRFKNHPPGDSAAVAMQQLHRYSIEMANNNSRSAEYMHFINDIGVGEHNLYEQLLTYYELKSVMVLQIPYVQVSNFIEQFEVIFKKKFLEGKEKDLIYQLSEASLTLSPDYENRIKLLTKLGYINENKIVQLKARVACEIGMNELLITELVLKGVFKDLKPNEVAALLSILVFKVRSREEENLVKQILEQATPKLGEAIEKLRNIHREILNLEISMNIRSEDIQEELNFGAVMIVYQWASNKSFAKIMQYCPSQNLYQEGIIVRCIQQLNDVICDIQTAAKRIGEPVLAQKMQETSAAIKRDIVFAPSLYTEEEVNIL